MCGIGASHPSLPRSPYIPSREKHKKQFADIRLEVRGSLRLVVSRSFANAKVAFAALSLICWRKRKRLGVSEGRLALSG